MRRVAALLDSGSELDSHRYVSQRAVHAYDDLTQLVSSIKHYATSVWL